MMLKLKFKTDSIIPQIAMRLCFSRPYTIPALVVLAVLKTKDSRRICITVPDGLRILLSHPEPDEGVSAKEQRNLDRKRDQQGSSRSLDRQPAQVIEIALRFKGARQRRERRGHRGNDLPGVSDQKSANRVKRNR